MKSSTPVRVFWWMFLIAAQVGASIPVLASENAVIPYKEIARMWEFVSLINPTNLVARVSVTSTNPAVPQSAIKLVIQSAVFGITMVDTSANGEIRRFPHSPDLLRENPPVVSNQPKGTLRLALVWRFPLSDLLAFRYSRLQNGVDEINKAIKAQAGAFAAVSPRASGAIFVFPAASAGKAKVEIVSPAGTKEYVSDAKGRVRLEIDPASAATTTEVKLSEKADLIIPDVN